jgi:hypothetical protein
MRSGRTDDFRIEETEFLVHAEVQGKGVRERGTWRVFALTFPKVERVDATGRGS